MALSPAKLNTRRPFHGDFLARYRPQGSRKALRDRHVKSPERDADQVGPHCRATKGVRGDQAPNSDREQSVPADPGLSNVDFIAFQGSYVRAQYDFLV